MKNKCCVFCRKSPPEVKISKEHVMRAALAKYLPPLTKEFTWKQTYILDGALEKVEKNLTIPQSAFDWLVNDVCKTCNEGWLNHNVEMPAEGILALAMQGRPMRAMEADTRSLALWASKTSAVRALMDPLPRAIPPAHYAHIKDRLEPAPNTLIWLAHTEFCSTPFMRHRTYASWIQLAQSLDF